MSEVSPNLTVIGLTGKIGSGKSTAAEFLKKRGWIHIDCDRVVHDLYKPGELGAKRIQTFFGNTYMLKSGEVNRKKLAKTLYKTPKKWEILNRMVHPLVAEELRRRLRAVESGTVVLEIQIYNERLFKAFIDQLWQITASDNIRTQRVLSRGLTPEQVQIISHHQPEGHMGVKIIENNGTEAELEAKLEDALKDVR